ncbi:GNAT family N-acetyltransferase [Elizabethkingia anophelis]|nr:GNAT family N-acetyltransferase [Elizabethkingia anophelis]
MIDFNTDYILENDKLILRPLVEEDYNQLVDFSLNEPEIWKFNAFGADSSENLKSYISSALSNRHKETEYPFVVFDKRLGKLIGSTRFYAINSINKTLELGYTWYGKNYQGTHVNKNCKYLLLEFAFENLGFERIGFKANNANKKSINAMKSIGCTEEGILRNFSLDAKGNRIDVIVLSILKNEWYSHVKSMLKNKIESI